MARLRRKPLLLVALVAAAAGGAFAVALAAQLGNDEGSRLPPATWKMRPLPLPAPLVSIRPLDRRFCRASRLLRPVCPRRVVSGLYLHRGVYLAPHGRAGERYDRFDLIGLPRRPARARHLVLFASRYGLARSGAGRIFAEWPWQGPAVGLRDGLTRGGRERSVLLARPTWAGGARRARSRPLSAARPARWRSPCLPLAVAGHRLRRRPERVGTGARGGRNAAGDHRVGVETRTWGPTLERTPGLASLDPEPREH